ncbi:MAG: hypothetical protein QXU69_07690 [Thermofilaceae archaeon]
MEQKGVEKGIEPVEWMTSWFRGTNTGHGEAIFSIKNKKFVKPRAKWKAKTEFTYKLLPGHYLYFSWKYWNRNDPPHEIAVDYVRLEKGENNRPTFKTLGRTTFKITKDYKFTNPILQDFFDGRPDYHGWPHIPFDKVYEEKDVRELIELALKRYEFVEGEEHE